VEDSELQLSGAEISQSAIPVLTPPQTPLSSQPNDDEFEQAVERMRWPASDS